MIVATKLATTTIPTSGPNSGAYAKTKRIPNTFEIVNSNFQLVGIKVSFLIFRLIYLQKLVL